MSEPTQLYRLTRELTVEEWRIFLDLLADPGPPSFMPVLVPVEPEEAWLTLEDIGPSAVWIVNHEEQPDYMAADHVLIVKLGDNGE